MSEPYGIEGITWDGEGPVMIGGRPYPLSRARWLTLSREGPETWDDPVGKPWNDTLVAKHPWLRTWNGPVKIPFPGFRFTVPLESGLHASVWIQPGSHRGRSDSHGCLCYGDWRLAMEEDGYMFYDRPCMRAPGERFLVEPRVWDDDVELYVDPRATPGRRYYTSRREIEWNLDEEGMDPVVEFWAMIEEFSRYGLARASTP